MGKRTKGVVRWFDGSKGYGYIDSEDGEEIFVHYTELAEESSPLLLAGEEVSFFREQSVRGPKATDVTYLN